LFNQTARAIARKKVERSFFGAKLKDNDAEEANRIGLEFFCRFVAFDLSQPADAVALKVAMKGWPGEMRDRRL
jgi:hypothetical protein